MKKGISLVALVITIIVLVILAGTIILTVTENGMINKSEEAVFKNNIKAFLEDYTNTKLEKQLKDKGGFNEATINASFVDNNIKEWIPNITDKFIEKIFISNGVFLADKSKYTEQEIVWLEELGIGMGYAPVIGTTDEWLLDDTKTKIVRYIGPAREDKTYTIPNRVKDSQTKEVYKITEARDDDLSVNSDPFFGIGNKVETVTISSNLLVTDTITGYYGVKRLFVDDNVTFSGGLYGSYLIECYIGNNVRVNGECIPKGFNLKKLSIGNNFYCEAGENGNVFNSMSHTEEVIIGDNFYCNSKYCLIGVGASKIEIGDNFYSVGQSLIGLNNVTSLQIGDNLKCDSAFLYGCDKLETLTIGDNAILTNHSIFMNDNLKTVNIGNNLSITSIGDSYSFFGNDLKSNKNPQLTTVNIGSFKNLCANALAGCTQIKKVILKNDGSITGVSAFQGCTGIEELEIGNVNMSSITLTHNTFKDCTGIKLVTIKSGAGETFPSGLLTGAQVDKMILEKNVKVRTNGFYSSIIKELVIEGYIEYISGYGSSSASKGINAFGNNQNLVKVTLGEGLTELSQNMFINCKNLNEITFPSTLQNIGPQCFSNSGLINIEIPGNIKTIGANAFANCDSLKSVTIRKGVTQLGDRMFVNCDILETVKIPDSVTTIGTAIFNLCPNLTSVTVGSEAVGTLVTATGYTGTIVVDTTINN